MLLPSPHLPPNEKFENVTFYFAINRNLNFELTFSRKNYTYFISFITYKIFLNPEKKLLNKELIKYV